MRNLILLILVSLLALTCNKDRYSPDYSDGRFWGIKNGEYWEAEAFASTAMDNRMAISIVRKNIHGFRRESLGISLIPIKIGEYKLHDHTTVMFGDSLIRATHGTLQDDGDVVEDRYKILEAEQTQFVRINKISNDMKWLEGEVECSFVLIPPKINLLNPDTVRFENCRFKVKRIN